MLMKSSLRTALFGIAAMATAFAPALAEAATHAGAGNFDRGAYETPDLMQTGPVPAGQLQEATWRDRDFHYRGHRRHGGGYGRNVCQPREAVHKAYRIGLRHPQIQRVSRDVIVVAGRNYGHWARVVFARWSPNCRIIGARGI